MKHAVAELLPFYLNGTLDAAERVRVEAELATCAACSAELSDLRELAASLCARADATAPPAAALLTHALERIATPPGHGLTTRLRTAWWGLPARYAAAVVLVAFVSAGAVAALHMRDAEYNQAGPMKLGVGLGSAQSVFRVSPAPDADKPAHARTLAATSSVARQHRLAKTATLALLVHDADASRAAAMEVTHVVGGDVISLADEGAPNAGDVHDVHLSIEVDAARLDDALDRFSQLGSVQHRTVEAEDLDASLVDQEARLRNLRREEIDLRQLMDKGGSVGQILTVEQQLSDVHGNIEELDAQHQHDLHRVATSTISLLLTEDHPRAAPPKPGPTARIDGAWHSGLNALADTVVAFISALAWAIAFSPIVIGVVAVGYLAKRGFGLLNPTRS